MNRKQVPIRPHEPTEPLGHGADMSLFVGGLDLCARSAKMKTPYSKGTDIGIEEPPHPFYLQRAGIHVDGQTEMSMHNAGILGQRRRTRRTAYIPPPPPSKRVRPRRTVRPTSAVPQKTKVRSSTPKRLPKVYPTGRLSQPWKPTTRKIATIPSVKVLGGHTHGMGLRPQPIYKTIQQNLTKLRYAFQKARAQLTRR